MKKAATLYHVGNDALKKKAVPIFRADRIFLPHNSHPRLMKSAETESAVSCHSSDIATGTTRLPYSHFLFYSNCACVCMRASVCTHACVSLSCSASPCRQSNQETPTVTTTRSSVGRVLLHCSASLRLLGLFAFPNGF